MATFSAAGRRGNIDACYDAVRWRPSDPSLLSALGDALLRANRPADALRTYQRVASLAPNMPGVVAKISAIEAKLSAKHASGRPPDMAPPMPNATRMPHRRRSRTETAITSGRCRQITKEMRGTMQDWDLQNKHRRGLLLTAAAAGATLAMPRMILAAAERSEHAPFGGDLEFGSRRNRQAKARGHQAPARLDRAALDRGRKPQHAGGRADDDRRC